MHTHRLRAAAAAQRIQPPQRRPVAVFAHHQALVLRQIGRLLRHAGALQIAGRADDDASVRCEPARTQRALLRPPQPHHGVEVAGLEVRQLLAQVQLQLDARVQRLKACQRRRHPRAAEAEARTHAQQPARLGQPLVELVLELGKAFERLGSERLALGRELQAARGAMEEPLLQPRFERGQALGHRGWCQV